MSIIFFLIVDYQEEKFLAGVSQLLVLISSSFPHLFSLDPTVSVL